MQEIVNKLVRPFGGAVTVSADGAVAVPKPAALADKATDQLADAAVFGDAAWRDAARWLLWELGQVVGVRPASIHDLYMARGQGKVHGFTVPAINIRGMAYDSARALFRAAVKREAGAFLFEIARSEMAYTDQRPAEYVAVLIAAALREGFRGPLFVQGDHFQANAKKYATDPEGEIGAIKVLIKEAVAAGFYNIDIDTSTLVDLKQPTLDTQQQRQLRARGRADDGDPRRGAQGRHDLGRRRDRRGRREEQHDRGPARLHGRLRPHAEGARRAARPGSRRSACRPARATAAWCCRTARSPR